MFTVGNRSSSRPMSIGCVVSGTAANAGTTSVLGTGRSIDSWQFHSSTRLSPHSYMTLKSYQRKAFADDRFWYSEHAWRWIRTHKLPTLFPLLDKIIPNAFGESLSISLTPAYAEERIFCLELKPGGKQTRYREVDINRAVRTLAHFTDDKKRQRWIAKETRAKRSAMRTVAKYGDNGDNGDLGDLFMMLVKERMAM